MENEKINAAVETWLSYEDTDRYNEDKARELIRARIEVREALRNGYQLVNMKEVKDIIQDTEEKIKNNELGASDQWMYKLAQEANAFQKIVQLLRGEKECLNT